MKQIDRLTWKHIDHGTAQRITVDAVTVVLDNLSRHLTGHYILCPTDGCILAHSLELCPQCTYREAVEPCLDCGTAVSPWAPCPVCSLLRANGRRSMIRHIAVPAGA